MKRPDVIAAGIGAVTLGIALACAYQASCLRTKAGTIQVGDTQAQVERLLGKPVMVTPYSVLWRTNVVAALFCETSETWAYGSRFNFHSQFPWLRFRFFLPDTGDVAVEFSRSGHVVRVTMPPMNP